MTRQMLSTTKPPSLGKIYSGSHDTHGNKRCSCPSMNYIELYNHNDKVETKIHWRNENVSLLLMNKITENLLGKTYIRVFILKQKQAPTLMFHYFMPKVDHKDKTGRNLISQSQRDPTLNKKKTKKQSPL